MTSEQIAMHSIKTAIFLPVCWIFATVIVSYLASFISYKRAQSIMRFGLYAGVVALVVGWGVAFVNICVIK